MASKCPRPPVTHLPLFCSLGEAGGAGAERRFFAKQKILLGLDGLDRRNGDRTGIVFIGDMCYTWVSKQTNKLELVRTGVYDEHDNMA